LEYGDARNPRSHPIVTLVRAIITVRAKAEYAGEKCSKNPRPTRRAT
jgi:hypothetical protein